MNTHDWLTDRAIEDVDGFNIVEVSFKNGASKLFYRAEPQLQTTTGDMVVVEANGGYDIGQISLSGELVRMQMKRRKVKEDSVIQNVIRIANERDMERLDSARQMEKPTLIKARAIARSLGLDMKIGDIEYQGDGRKAIFFYTANGRVDFRELIRHYAKEFRVKIEMRQIGARQESARIGGLGACGRELCCSTWLTDFKSVSTGAARYQNLAINQVKLSGQCGRLKCCLNYELDTYMEAIKAFPERADRLQLENGTAVLVKTDVFKQLMFYTYTEGRQRGQLFALDIEQVRAVQAINKSGQKGQELSTLAVAQIAVDDEPDYEDVTGAIELPAEQRNKKKKKKKKRSPGDAQQRHEQAPRPQGERPEKQQPRSGENRNAGSNNPRPPRDNDNRRSRDSNDNRRKPPRDNAPNAGQAPNQQQQPPRQRPPQAGGEQPGAEGNANKPGNNKRRKSRNKNRGNRPNKPDGGGTES